MRLGRMITAGTLGIGAFRAYQQYKGENRTTATQRSRFGPLRSRSNKQQRSGGKQQQRRGVFRR